MAGLPRQTVQVYAPLAGTVVPLTDVPDPVFAGSVVGAGLAILPAEPDLGTERVVVVSPCAGHVASVYPHAVMVQAAPERAVLVHLGVATDGLGGGAGFHVAVGVGDAVTPGQPLMAWSPADVRSGGRSTLCPLVALGAHQDDVVPLVAAGEVVAEGQAVLLWG